MARKVERLAPATRRALMCASCIGPSFELRTLATIVEKSPWAVAADLREGLVQPLGGNYRLLEGAGDALDPMDVAVPYRFLHDRVKEACYALVPEAERPAMHLAIGRLLVARGGGARGTAGLSGGASDVSGQVPDEDLLEVVRHLNLGAREITDETERMDVARLDLRAGRRAMAATAFEAAASLFAAGRALASEKGFRAITRRASRSGWRGPRPNTSSARSRRRRRSRPPRSRGRRARSSARACTASEPGP